MRRLAAAMCSVLVIISFSVIVHAQETVTLLVHWQTGEQLELLSAAVNEYNAMNPGVNVELVGSGGGAAGQWERFLVMTAAGVPPSGVHILGDHLKTQGEMFSPIPSHLEARITSGYHPVALALTAYQGQPMGFPTEFQTPAVIYHKRLFEESGVGHAPTPSSWDDFWALARRLTRTGADGNVAQSGFATGAAGKPDHVGYELFANGHSVISPDGEPRMNSAEMLELVTRWKEYVDLRIVSLDDARDVARGLAAMTIYEPHRVRRFTTEAIEDYEAGNILTGPVPFGSLGQPYAKTYGYAWMVPATNANPGPTWDFLVWLNLVPKESGITRMGEVLATLGSLPPALSDGRSPVFEQPFFQGYIEAAGTYVEPPLPDVPGASSWAPELRIPLRRIYAGIVSVINGLEEAQTGYRNRLQEAAAALRSN